VSCMKLRILIGCVNGPKPCRVNVPRQVGFINGVKMMVSGSDDGQILIWNEEGVMVQALGHGSGK